MDKWHGNIISFCSMLIKFCNAGMKSLDDYESFRVYIELAIPFVTDLKDLKILGFCN